MFVFQVQKSANGAHEIIATYKNIETGKEYHRHLLTRADGKVCDLMMNANRDSEAAWTTRERWKARLGLNQEKFEFAFGGKGRKHQLRMLSKTRSWKLRSPALGEAP